ncbi:hypothetical protein HK100_002877 [Physocladia obscura]|uniref:Uncharacterized protein n=1 Tax=Physocladia obscura TaxID=109957 RepID=A0AAD5SVP8_9FUNG|nr:hypothetical protein HK100_002877 [Physocladia obscura]
MPKPISIASPKDAKKEAAWKQNAMAVAANYAWLDRMVKEAKAQREWTDKWSALNDSKLYLGESAPSDAFSGKAPVEYHIINTPKRNPLSSRPSSAENDHKFLKDNIRSGAIHGNFKITGPRTDFLSYTNSRHPTHPTPLHYSRTQQRPLAQDAFTVSGYSQDYSPAFRKTTPANTPTSSNKLHKLNKLDLVNLKNSTSATTETTSRPTEFKTHRPPPVGAMFDNSADIDHEMGSEKKILAPAAKYVFPPTSNMEYGWVYHGRTTLETFGNTSANFAKESWKRAQQMH